MQNSEPFRILVLLNQISFFAYISIPLVIASVTVIRALLPQIHNLQHLDNRLTITIADKYDKI